MSETPIFIDATNFSFSDVIPTQHQDSGIEDFVHFIKSCPLLNAFCDVPNRFYPKQVCEFYYSCIVDTNGETISGTVGDGHSRSFIYAASIRQVLHLPQFDHYFEVPFEVKCRSIHTLLCYVLSL